MLLSVVPLVAGQVLPHLRAYKIRGFRSLVISFLLGHSVSCETGRFCAAQTGKNTAQFIDG